ncbi:MAG: DUF4349 domain-containing protein [Lachnospiraceae bacterium]|nr:DUF4349 domain-containing protein [Lachnospiraceae bacterium]MBQ7360165.1 DUF4349 domain-containing protein [Lachnospiraceae bacterium]
MKKRKGLLSVLCILAISLTACGSASKMESSDMAVNDSYYDYGYAEEYYPEADYVEEKATEDGAYGVLASGSSSNTSSKETGQTGADTDTTVINGEKLVYTCNIVMETLNYDQCITRLRENIEKYDGFVESENETDDAGRWYYENYKKTSGTKHMSLTVRIPTQYYNDFLSGIEGQDKITSKRSYVDNISRQYYDTSARIEALEIQQDRLLDMLAAATEIEDMITIESRLSEVQYQLNSAKTSLASMDADVAFSTITVNVSEVMEYTPQTEPVKSNTFMDRLKNTLSETWDFFWEMLEVLLFAVIRLIPIALVVGVVVLVVGLIFKANKKKMMKKAAAQQVANPPQN